MGTPVSFSSVILRTIAVVLACLFGFTQLHAADPTFSIKAATSNPGISELVTADFNADGNADLATIDSSGFSVLLGKGDGSFNAPIINEAGSRPASVVIGDVNGDSIPDVAIGGDQLRILIGNGNGSFRSGAILPGSTPGFGEFNLDGRLDLAFVASGGVWIALGDGAGNFGTPTQVDSADLFANVGPLTIGDFDGDGVDDIAFSDCCDPTIDAASVGRLRVLYGNGVGAFAPNFVEQSGGIAYLRTVDINSDSIDDLAESWSGCHTPCMGVTVFLGNPDRQLHRLSTVGEPTFEDYLPGPGVAADFNTDGRNDLAFPEPNFFPQEVAATARNSVFVSLQNSDGTLTDPPLEFPVGAGASGPKIIATADFNGDGKPDLATRNGDATLAILLNITGGTSGGGVNPSADFSLTAVPQQVTMSAGTTAQVAVSVTGTGGFNEPVALSCSGLPAGASCTFNPATVNTGATSTLTIATTGTTASLRQSPGLTLAVWLPVVGMIFAGARLPNRKKLLLLLAVAILTLLVLQACGGDGPQNSTGNRGGSTGGGNNNGGNGGSGGGSNFTPTGQYQVTVTGTSGSLQRTTAITLTVQ
jgi:hypothetical protein